MEWDQTYKLQKWEKRHIRLRSYALIVIAGATSFMAMVQFVTLKRPPIEKPVVQEQASHLTTLWVEYENCITDVMVEFSPMDAIKEKLSAQEYNKRIDAKCLPYKIAFEEAKRQK